MKRLALLIVLIFSLLAVQAESITYTITGRNQLTAEGTAPTGAGVQLSMSSTTGQIKQITAGNYISLTLQNWAGVTLSNISLSMKSNTKAGAGTISVTRGNTRIYTQTGNFKEIAGTYSTAYVSVNLPIQPFTVSNNEEVTILITASENSLYVESFTFTYTVPVVPETLYTVRFKTNTPDVVLPPLTETSQGSGVVLPRVNYSSSDNPWTFIGWTEQPCAETSIIPTYRKAGTRFYPTQNTVLYALYTDNPFAANYTQLTDFQGEGLYYIAGRYGQQDAYVATNFAKRNSNYVINATECNLWQNSEGLYYIEQMPASAERYLFNFQSNNTLTISCEDFSRTIGYSSNSLTETASVWNYVVNSDSSLYIYYTSLGKEYALYLTVLNQTIPLVYGWKVLSVSTRPTNGIILLQSPEAAQKTYTAYPEGAQYDGVEQSNVLKISIVNHYILNPARERLTVYNVAGMLICSTEEDINLAGWQAGAYIVRNTAGQSTMFIYR